jgi:hypothetical protein
MTKRASAQKALPSGRFALVRIEDHSPHLRNRLGAKAMTDWEIHQLQLRLRTPLSVQCVADPWLLPAGRLVPRISGGLLGAAGVWLLFSAVH